MHDGLRFNAVFARARVAAGGQYPTKLHDVQPHLHSDYWPVTTASVAIRICSAPTLTLPHFAREGVSRGVVRVSDRVITAHSRSVVTWTCAVADDGQQFMIQV